MAPKKKPEGDLKNQRIPIMMTEAELKEIDDWSFENRIRSRGEAIRRLCKIGLLANSELEEITNGVAHIHHKIIDDHFQTLRSMVELSRQGGTLDQKTVRNVFNEVQLRSIDTAESSEIVYTMISALLDALEPMASAKTIEQADQDSAQALSAANERIQEMLDRDNETEQALREVEVWSKISPEEIDAYRLMSGEEREDFMAARIAKLQADRASANEG